jgi:TusA-related sulfurtransferase
MKNGELKITKIDPKTVDWRPSRGKYLEVKKKVASLKIGEALCVECDAKALGAGVRQYCFKKVKGVYGLRTRFTGKVWYFMKTDK